ncbi:hypothetical protein DL546_004492 [Coniochaeta pulveracea]|uniref:F-box domain-containing protein n=1 Tax=Coniochaeta pulveracea TaxID=177199 RepID=A0A420YNJ4_9PEZI|nr:hypothetical protein DL546_004492 [Coniochaeta pulveracea]
MLETLYPSNPGSPQAGLSFDFGARSAMGLTRQDSFSREDHRAKEQSLPRNSTRAPRRSHTFQDFQIPTSPVEFTLSLRQVQQDRRQQQEEERQQETEVQTQQPSSPGDSSASSSLSTQLPATIASTDFAQPTTATVGVTPKTQKQVLQARPAMLPQRPSLGVPRRSYSVMNYEPLPHHHRPPVIGSGGLSLMDLPPELHYAIFDFLDPIDSTCMGLTNKHFYAIHRRLHGTVPLSTRRDGPNELEWAWHLHQERDQAVDQSPAPGQAAEGGPELTADQERNALARLRVKGQAYCRKCGVCRCELHKHIQEWMGEGMEYCIVRQKYGPVAPEGSKPFCYMSTPRNPNRCGRHRVRNDKVKLQ